MFNCQGAGQWVWPVKQTAYVPTNINITGQLSPSDVESLEEIAGDDWNGETAVYAFGSCKYLLADCFFLTIPSYHYTISD